MIKCNEIEGGHMEIIDYLRTLVGQSIKYNDRNCQ